MIEQAITYKFTKGLRRAKQRYVTLSIVLPIVLISVFALSPLSKDNDLTTTIMIGFAAFVVFGVIFYITASMTLRKLSELSVSMFSDRFERDNGKYKEIFFWKDVQRVDHIEYPDGELAVIKLTLVNKKIVNLFGLDNMNTASKQIGEAISGDIPIHKKRMTLNWDKPLTMAITLFVALAIILAIQALGEKAYRFFNVIFCLSYGSYILFGKPFSSAQGKRWRNFEVIAGVLMIIGAVLMLGSALLLQ